MLLSRQLSLADLITLCRALRHNLGAGLPVVRVFRQQSSRGPLRVRPIAGRIADQLQEGESLQAALDRDKHAFPPLFLALAGVGEKTGHLPEIFGELEKYYSLQQRLWRTFLGQIAWPVFQLVAAILVIAFLLFILGIIGEMNHSKPLDPLGLGWTGSSGAVKFLIASFGSIAAIFVGYLVVSRSLRYKARVDWVLLAVPVLGTTIEALALTRFCLALRLTMETGMSILQAVKLSLRATGTAAFAATADDVAGRLRAGDDLTAALAGTRLFPREFQDILATAEEGGRVPEVMRQQAEFYEEEAARRLRVLSQVAGWIVWLLVAGLIIWSIFRIFMTAYLQPMRDVEKEFGF